jgi:hypothetical protein
MNLTIEIEYILDNIDLVRSEKILSTYSYYMRYRNTHFPCITINDLFEDFDIDEKELTYLLHLQEKYGFENLKKFI